MPLIKRHRSLTEAVFISFGSTSGFPKTLQLWRANASQQQIICCTVSVSFLHNLQVGSLSNRPIVHRCPLTGACPVRIPTTIFSWCLQSLSMSSALILHGLPVKSLPCLWPGKSLQAPWCWYSVQLIIASLDEHQGKVYVLQLYNCYLYLMIQTTWRWELCTAETCSCRWNCCNTSCVSADHVLINP